MKTENDVNRPEGSLQRPVRLWRVAMQRTLMVMAADESQAKQEAEYYLWEDNGEPDKIVASAVSSIEDIPKKWRNGIPWGGDRNDDRPCRERVEPPNDPKFSDAPIKRPASRKQSKKNL
jgi:hypothetical protein